MKTQEHEFDFCVVGGGMAGITAAISAARQGAKTALMHDRPVFGGNASSEIRVHICGADRHNQVKNMRETGILEEIRLENMRRNPHDSFGVWDTILYEKVMNEPNITAFMNCSCLQAETEEGSIRSVTGWQLTTETYHIIKAKVFADCSGDGILAPLSGAEFRIGREARSEYDEAIEPEEADTKTMGMTILFQAKDIGASAPFEALEWAYSFPEDSDLPKNFHGYPQMGFWWIELGGEHDSIHDTEKLKHELLKIMYGVWDHMKNHGDHGIENWTLDWVQFLPGKRESRRYIGDHVVTQNDIEAQVRFNDIVGYGGWSMDDHDPAGFWAFKTEKPATIFHKAPSPYGIPYRSLYSKNIDNLYFAGRCASFTHAAMSSARVMGTLMTMGQAVGNAAALAVGNKITPREVGADLIETLQSKLQYQDCWLPGKTDVYNRVMKDVSISATGDSADVLMNGINRPVGEITNAWEGKPGDAVELSWDEPVKVRNITLIVNSALDKNIALSYHEAPVHLSAVPDEMIKDIDVEAMVDGEWMTVEEIRGNYQRLVRFNLGWEVTGIRTTFKTTWGSETVRVYAFYVD